MNSIRDRYNIAPREWECLLLCAQGFTAKTIAAELGVSKRTIESYIEKMKNKTGLFSKRDLAELIRKETLNLENEEGVHEQVIVYQSHT